MQLSLGYFKLLLFGSIFLGNLIPSAQAEKLYTKTHSGEWIQIDSEKWSEGKTPVSTVPKGTNLSYTVTHNDGGSGFGFDDPTEGADRLATVNAVLDYIDTVIQDGGRLDVEFNASINTGSGTPLASAGSFYPGGPSGFEPGRAFEHIVTGVDPSPSLPDIQVTVDFGYVWNSQMDDPLVSEVDFFSVMLHELTHGLGIISLVDSDGTSDITGTNPGVFSTFDQFLRTGSGDALFGGGGQFLGSAGDLIGLDGGIRFHGLTSSDVLGFPPRVYSPNPWMPGSSIGHWSSTNSGVAVMLPTISSGVKRRQFVPFEIGALGDIGYQVSLPAPPTSEVVGWIHYE